MRGGGVQKTLLPLSQQSAPWSWEVRALSPPRLSGTHLYRTYQQPCVLCQTRGGVGSACCSVDFFSRYPCVASFAACFTNFSTSVCIQIYKPTPSPKMNAPTSAMMIMVSNPHYSHNALSNYS